MVLLAPPLVKMLFLGEESPESMFDMMGRRREEDGGIQFARSFHLYIYHSWAVGHTRLVQVRGRARNPFNSVRIGITIPHSPRPFIYNDHLCISKDRLRC